VKKILSILPEYLSTDINLYLNRDVMQSVRLFEGLDLGFLPAVISAMTTRIFVPEELVVRFGEDGDSMFVISYGEVEVMVNGGKTVVAKLRAGDHFGEYAMLFHSLRSASIRAISYVDVFELKRKDFDRICSTFPDSKDLILERTRVNMKRTLAVDKQFESGAGGTKSSKVNKFMRENNETVKEQDDRFIILPDDKWWRVFQFLCFLGNLFFVFSIPARIAYDLKNTTVTLLALDYLFDATVVIEIALSFRLAFFEYGQLVTDYAAIRQHYMKRSFWLGVFAVLPIDLVMLKTGITPLVRLNRLVRLVPMYSYINSVIQDSKASASKLKLARMMFTLVVLAHFIGAGYFCFTYFEGYLPATNTSHEPWLPEAALAKKSPLYRFWQGFYFAMFQLTALGKPAIAESNAEICFTLIVGYTGVVAVAMIISNVTHIITNLDVFAVKNDKTKLMFHDFLKLHQLPSEMKDRVRKFLDYDWNINRGAHPDKALWGIPMALKMEIKTHLCKSALNMAFKNVPDVFLAEIIQDVRFETFPAGEIIFSADYHDNRIYFVNNGVVELRSHKDDETVIALMSRGSIIGESTVFTNRHQ
jgi:CRP-like cAMP-binding protein